MQYGCRIFCNMKTAVVRAVRQFLETTTLHGFKYLWSPFCADRVGWVACCCASACCAGILCTVLWARFLNAPTLLALLDSRDAASSWFPTVGICTSPHRIAQLFARKMSIKQNQTNVYLPSLFFNLLREKTMAQVQIQFLEHVLSTHNLTLYETLAHVTEPCNSVLRACRLGVINVPCDKLFHKQIGPSGVCCVAPDTILNILGEAETTMNPQIDLLLHCSEESTQNGCEYFSKFSNEEWISHVELSNGYNYRAPLVVTAIMDADQDKLIDGNCVSQADYTRKKCLTKCKEQKCGCSDPLSASQVDNTLPPCPITRMNCLRSFKLIEDSCNCPAACRKVSSQTLLESNRIHNLRSTIDPIFEQANATSIYISIKVRHSASKIFDLRYTQTWWSLLSSLGGLFNMFLGVGLFSALEVLFLLAGRLPASFRRSTELPPPAPVPITITAIY